MQSKELEKSRMWELASLIARWFRPSGSDDGGEPSVERPQPGVSGREHTDSVTDLGSRIDEIQSIRDALVYLCDHLLPRLHDSQDFPIAECREIFDALDSKFQVLLSAEVNCSSADVCPDLDAIRIENSELKARIENLHALRIRAVPETDIAMSQELECARGKLKDQQGRIVLAAKKLKTLAHYYDMFQKLKVEHNLVLDKMEHQGMLLRSFTAENPRHQQMLAQIEKLSDENRHLKLELRQKSELLSRIKGYLPAENRQIVEELIQKNDALIGDMEEKSAQLDVARGGGNDSLVDHFERLNRENAHLKRIKEARKCVVDFIESQGKNDPNEMIEILRIENERMESSINDTEEMIETLAESSPTKGLIDAYTSLRRDYRQVFLENQCKDQVFRNQEEEKRWLRAQVREKTALIKKNQILEVEIQSRERFWEDKLGKFDEEFEELKREAAGMRSRYERTLVENENLRMQVARLNHDHEVLVKHLDTVFGEQDLTGGAPDSDPLKR